MSPADNNSPEVVNERAGELPAGLADALERVLRSDHEKGPSIGEIVDSVGEKGFGILFLVLSLPSAIPVPAPGYSTPFGVVIALIALQMFLGRRVLWIPQRLRRVRLNPKKADRIISAGAAAIRRIERFIRPRHHWIGSPLALRALAVVLLSMGGLMIFPIPLTNTAPAIVVFLLGLGLAEEDGLLVLGAFVVGCVAVLLYAGVIYLVWAYGPDAVDEVWKASALR
ncbi:MAG: exopolysaccharide biosynthesis protein [Candidatus Brocadiia bacterium]